MIHLIICGHGEFATGLLSGARLLCGDITACHAVNFSEGMSSEALHEALQACLDDREPGTAVLCLTDILGGTPFRECSTLVAALPQAEVISGANLQMLTEAVLEREDIEDVHVFAHDLIDSAKECMILLSDKLANQAKQTTNTEEDGI